MVKSLLFIQAWSIAPDNHPEIQYKVGYVLGQCHYSLLEVYRPIFLLHSCVMGIMVRKLAFGVFIHKEVEY